MLRAKQVSNGSAGTTRQPNRAAKARVKKEPKARKDDRPKVTVYLSKSTNRKASALAKARQITMSAALNRLIERGLEYPDDESIRSIRSDLEDTKDALITSINDRQSAYMAGLHELQRATATGVDELQKVTDELLWVTVSILTGRLRAGDFGATPDDRRSRAAEFESLVEEYIQHRVPSCLNRIVRNRSRH